MWEWITWGFALGIKVFGAAAGVFLAMVIVFLFAIFVLAAFLELFGGICEWAAKIMMRLSGRLSI